MWKWWEHTFGERKNYLEMSEHFGNSLFAVYEKSSTADRLIIVDIFGRSTFDVTRPAAELRVKIVGPPKTDGLGN